MTSDRFTLPGNAGKPAAGPADEAAALRARYANCAFPGALADPIDEKAALHERYGEQLMPAWSLASAATAQAIAAAGRPPLLADAALSAIRGCTDAQRLLATIREGCAPADALLDGMVQVLQLGDPERTRGFFRELQKRLERLERGA